jgi:biopolymer transport protein ExbD
LVQIRDDGVSVNGQTVTPEALIQALTRLTETETDAILIRTDEGVALQRLLDVMAGLEAAGFTNLGLVAP